MLTCLNDYCHFDNLKSYKIFILKFLCLFITVPIGKFLMDEMMNIFLLLLCKLVDKLWSNSNKHYCGYIMGLNCYWTFSNFDKVELVYSGLWTFEIWFPIRCFYIFAAGLSSVENLHQDSGYNSLDQPSMEPLKLNFNPYSWIFGTVMERNFWKNPKTCLVTSRLGLRK